MSTVVAFRLRNTRSDHYICGYAASLEIGEGRILIKDRRIPWARFFDGVPIEYAQCLGNLELPAESDSGWAAWGVREMKPDWWDRAGSNQATA